MKNTNRASPSSAFPAALLGGLVGATLVALPLTVYLGGARGADADEGRVRSAAAVPAAAEPEAPARDPALASELTMLNDRVAELGAELDLLRAELSRRPAPDAARTEPTPEDVVLAAAAERTEFTDEQREAIADILARAREQEAELRATERAAREEQMVLDRAGRIAETLALAPADEAVLADHLRDEAERRRAIIERSRGEDYDRETLRDEFVALRDWSEQHLIDTFGADLAGQIRVAERDTRGSSLDRGGRRGGQRDGGGGGPGRGR